MHQKMTEYTGIAVKEHTCTSGDIGSDLSKGPDFPDHRFQDYIQMETRKRVFLVVSLTHHLRTGSHRIRQCTNPTVKERELINQLYN